MADRERARVEQKAAGALARQLAKVLGASPELIQAQVALDKAQEAFRVELEKSVRNIMRKELRSE
jgi:hypothetical protein